MTDVQAINHTKVVVFYSYASGVGLSCMVANIALILASRGYRVLVVDLDLVNPSLYRYLSAFLPVAQGTPSVNSPVRLTCNFVDQRGSVDFAGPTGDIVANPADFTIQRPDLIERGYDFVLVDGPEGAGSVALTRELADVLVLGYSLNKQILDKTAYHAQAIQAGGHADTIRVLPVPMRVDQNAGGVTARMRVEGRRQLAWLVADMPEDERQQYWNGIEIPYEPDYAMEEGLPFLDDSSDQRNRLMDAYVRLAALLAPGWAPVAQAVTDQTRARYRAMRLTAARGNAAITVLHAAEDRYWAEWLVSELQRMELVASRHRIDRVNPTDARDSSEMLVVSRHLLALPDRDDHLSAVASPPPPGSQVQLGVSIDGSRLPSSRFPTLGYVDLAAKSAKEAREELASYYQVPRPSPSARGRLYYPGRKERWVSNLPARASTCHGRDDAIDRIRDHFTSSERQTPLTLTGPSGIGKSQLALEYAYRFADHYDLVFRIRSNSVQAVRADLAELAVLTGPVHPGGDAGLAALRELDRESTEASRWLLIYNGVETSAVLDGLLPESGHGHVLLTAQAAIVGSSKQLTVGPLAPSDASAMLVELVPSILPAEAGAMATALDGVPLALRMAAGWVRVVVDQLLTSGVGLATVTGNAVRELGTRLANAPGGAPADPARAMVNLLIDLLKSSERGAAALLLLETCAFLAPIGMSQRLLRSPGMLAQLTEADSGIADNPVVVHNVLRILVAHGFSLPGATTQEPLQIHPRVMEILRDRMSPDHRARRTRAVTQMLAASAPLDIDNDVIRHTEIYTELLQHAEPSGALLETDAAVRRWLVNQVRFLWQTETVSAWKSAADLGERLAEYWAQTLQDKEDDKLLLRLRTQLANIYRSLGDFGRALAIDGDVLSRQRRVLGLRHLRTLMTARSYGGDLRLMGDFEGALLEDQSTWLAFSQTLGDDHLMTIIASSNLALSELMYGDPEQALERQKTDIVRCQQINSERPWQEPWILFHVGTLLREVGLYEESRERLTEAKVEFDDLVAYGVMAPTVWVVLRAAAGLAITRRRLGQPSLDVTEHTLEVCRSTYGARYPDLLALSLSWAGDLHTAMRHDEAVEQAEQAREGYISVFGAEHPCTRLCEVDLSIYALAACETQRADEMSEMALSALDQALVPGHLWTLAASVARANVLATTGRLEYAQALEEQTLSEYRRRLGHSNPLTKTAAINAAVTRMQLNEPGNMPDLAQGMERRRAIELDAPPY